MIHSSKYKLLTVLVFVGLLSSCKKEFLELAPPTSLTPDVALATEADLLVALRGAYAGLRAVDFYGRTIPVLGDIRADNSYQHSLNTNRYTLYNNYTFNTTDGNALGIWNAGYTVILRANNIINAQIATTVNVDQYKGEAYAVRALSYFTLIRNFARPYTDNPAGLGVPISLTYDPNAKPPRSTVAEVYALILADLTKAYTLMTKFTNSSQFSKYAARALQAKVYLTMGDNTNAKTAALDVINNSGFTSLTTANHATYWASGLIRTDKLETLFEVSSDAVANLAFDALSYIYSQAGNYGDLVVSSELIPVVHFSPPPAGGTTATGVINLTSGSVASVTITSPGSGYTSAPTVTFAPPPSTGATATGTATITGGAVTGVTVTTAGSGYTELIPVSDIRRGLYPSVPRPATPPGAWIPSVNKFPVISGDLSDTKVLRLSEMYLIAAEASLPANETDALTYVNYIRSRRGAATIASTGGQLLEDILTERRIELAFEGDRYMDLMRLKRDVVRSTNYPAAARNMPYSNFRRILPIPQTELDANENIRTQQNPGF